MKKTTTREQCLFFVVDSGILTVRHPPPISGPHRSTVPFFLNLFSFCGLPPLERAFSHRFFLVVPESGHSPFLCGLLRQASRLSFYGAPRPHGVPCGRRRRLRPRRNLSVDQGAWCARDRGLFGGAVGRGVLVLRPPAPPNGEGAL